MAVVSFRIYCEDCTNEEVIRDDEIADSPWSISNKYYHTGICPSCNPAVSTDTASSSNDERRVQFEELDSIGAKGASNLREAGIVTRQDVKNASDDDVLSVAWVGESGLESIRNAVR